MRGQQGLACPPRANPQHEVCANATGAHGWHAETGYNQTRPAQIGSTAPASACPPVRLDAAWAPTRVPDDGGGARRGWADASQVCQQHARTAPPKYDNWSILTAPPHHLTSPTLAYPQRQQLQRMQSSITLAITTTCSPPPPPRRRHPLHPPKPKRTMMTGNGGNGRPPEVKTDRQGRGRLDTRRGGLVAARRGWKHVHLVERADAKTTPGQWRPYVGQVAHLRHPPPRTNIVHTTGSIESSNVILHH